MKAVKVQYRVKSEYVEQNKTHIRRVMQALKSNPIDGMQYATFTIDDGQTFLHINMARDSETMSKLGKLPEFVAFREALKASEPINPPTSTELNLVEAGFLI